MNIHGNHEKSWKSMEIMKIMKYHENPWKIKKIIMLLRGKTNASDHYWWRYEWITIIRYNSLYLWTATGNLNQSTLRGLAPGDRHITINSVQVSGPASLRLGYKLSFCGGSVYVNICIAFWVGGNSWQTRGQTRCPIELKPHETGALRAQFVCTWCECFVGAGW